MEELLGVWKEFRKDVTEAEAGRVGWGRILEGLARQVKRPGQALASAHNLVSVVPAVTQFVHH